jgi:hypothetical protein
MFSITKSDEKERVKSFQNFNIWFKAHFVAKDVEG